MLRSSESVAALASALAKAQAELINPEKLLVATLPAERGQAAQIFRYAPLSGGLDIVRKTLGRNEIATIQATSIDRESGTIKLTTTLAHASGEWVASDWPVCPLADLATPKRMGAALTYARRYALFTLVGIAGEDDLDSPDLESTPASTAQVSSPPMAPSPVRKHRKNSPDKAIVTLSPEESQRVRDHLLDDLTSIGTFEAAAEWAKRILPTKNALTAKDAGQIESAVEVKFARFESVVGSIANASDRHLTAAQPQKDTTWNATVDRSNLTFGHAPRRRDKAHLKFVASQPCLLCSRQPSDAHHLRFAQVKALGRKVSDEFTVPLCRTHHRQVHRVGNELAWWNGVNIDAMEIAKRLWAESRGKLPVRSSMGNEFDG